MQVGRTMKAIAAAVVLALGAAACGSSSGSGSGSGSTPAPSPSSSGGGGGGGGQLLVGTLLPQTGALAFLGPPMIKGTQLAARDVNAGGGVNGKPIKLDPTDDGTDVNVASQSVDTLISDHVSAIVGAAASTVTLGVIDKIVNAGLVECSPSNTASSFTTYPDKGLYFRTAPPDNLQAIALGNTIIGDGHSNVALIARADQYGKGLEDGVAKVLTDSGASIAAKVTYDPKATTFDAEVGKVKNSHPDAIVLVAFAEGAQVLKTMISAGIGPKQMPIYVTDGLQSSTLWKSVDPKDPAVLEGIKGTAASAAPSNGVKSFPAEFKKFAPGVDTIYSAQSYDCVTVISLAAEAAKSTDPAAIQKQMVPVTTGGTKCTSYKDCKALLDQGQDINYDGASGPLDFTPAGDPSIGTYDVWQFDKKGAVTTIKQVVVNPKT